MNLSMMIRIEWPTVLVLGLAYGGWTAAGIWLAPVSLVSALVVMGVMAALHSSLQHEALHGHPTRSSFVNELLVSLPLSVWYPYRRFKTLHLRHHQDEHLTDPYDDPESWYRAEGDHKALSALLKWALAINNTLAGRLLIGPPLMVAGFLINEWPLLRDNKPGLRRAWAHHVLGLAALSAILALGFGINPLVYAVTSAWLAFSIIAVRTFCEHQWSDPVNGRTIIVEKGGLLAFLFLNNNLHVVHHSLPRAPWYELPRLYREARDRWNEQNGGYTFSGYGAIVRQWLFAAKEPVVHPALRRLQTGVQTGPAGHGTLTPANGNSTVSAGLPIAAGPDR